MTIKPRRKVLVFIDWFYPAYKAGGPIKSVYNIASQLKDEFEFIIISSNQDVDGEYLKVESDVWQEYKGIQVMYLSKKYQIKARYKELFKALKPDTIYYNSLFSYNFTILPYFLFRKSSVKQMIAPRGMLGKGALSIKPFKKNLFIWLSNKILFNKETTFWHATSRQEAKEIKDAIGYSKLVKIAKNLSSELKVRNNIVKKKGELKLVFISRISEKKNLLYLLKLILSIKGTTKITLSIYGPIEDQSYWAKCISIIKNSPNITYEGIIKPEEIGNTIQQFHFYILPTLHENYGHSIVESILSGVPVIISKETPWINLHDFGIGIDLSLSEKSNWINYLIDFQNMEQKEYDNMTKNCYIYAKENIVNQDTINQSIRLFKI